ncbi:unnamed protein product [Camellia sinensis]
MAATRVIATVASTNTITTTTTTALLFRGPLRRSNGLSLCFNTNNNSRLVPKRRSFTCTALYKPEIHIKEEGQPQTLDFRVFFLDNSGKKVSPWHDIPLRLDDGVFNFIVEIPKETSAKMEVATDEQFTPIKQDTKNGKLRFYPTRKVECVAICGLLVSYRRLASNHDDNPNVQHNINWNYGLLPQTWEDRSLANSDVGGALGDNDPVDVVEIGDSQGKIGQIMKVKPLAALAMIDEGELDWKIVAISLDDPRASVVNDVDDVEKHFPHKDLFARVSLDQPTTCIFHGTLTAIRNWFRDYKIPDGKPPNEFGLGNKAANKDYALKVITETNESWARLVKRSIPAGGLSLC